MSLSNDELSALSRLQFPDLGSLISGGCYTDGHPCGVQVFEFYWVHIFGDGVFALRFTFALAGVVSVYLVYQIGRENLGEYPGLLAASLMSGLQVAVFYSQLARPYSFGLLFFLAFLIYWFRILIRKNFSLYNSIGFAGFATACAYTHYIAAFDAVLFALAGLLIVRKEHFIRYLGVCLFPVLLFLPHVGITLNHFSYRGLGWLEPPTIGFFKGHLKYLFNNSWMLLLLLASLMFAYAIFIRKTESERPMRFYRIIFLIGFGLPIGLLFLYSIYLKPILQNALLYFTFPLLLLFMSSFLVGRSLRIQLGATILLLLLLLDVHLVKSAKYYSRPQFGLFKELADFTVRYCHKFGDENIEKTININNPFYINYYLGKMGHNQIVFAQYRNDGTVAELEAFKKIVEQSAKPYFLFAWSGKGNPPELVALVMQKYPVLIEKEKTDWSEIMIFSRGK